MRNRTCVYCLVMSAVAVLSGPGLAVAQSLSAVPVAATATTVVPSLVRYAGVVAGHDGKTVSATFFVFKDETGGVPLWSEAQSVTPDAAGHFEVYLGAANVSGLPVELFGTGEARWVEVQMAGSAPQPRVLLASVPYAMKAADAATLGGLPASAYALAGTANATAAAANTAAPDATAHTVTTTDGTTGYLPVFSGATTIDDSIVFQSGTKIGIGTKAPAATLDIEGAIIGRGLLTLEATGVATATAGKDSQALELMASAYSSSLKKAESEAFSLQAEPATNNTTTPAATLNFLYGASGATPTETGLSISSKGILKFATGQTFPGGGGTITGVTTTAPLTGSGTTGSVTVGLNLTTLETSLNAKYAQLGAADKFTGLITFGTGQTFPGMGTITGVTAGTGLLGGGTTGKVTLSLNPASVPTLTGSPVFNSNAGNGVEGITAGNTINKAGVYGEAGPVSGISNVAAGIWGDAYTQVGVEGTSHTSPGVYGESVVSNGVEGVASGNTLNTAGVLGIAGSKSGVTNGIAGVWGDASAHVGVLGTSAQFSGVQGSSTTNNGVFGSSISGPGVSGSSNTGHAGQFSNASAEATIYAVNAVTSGGSAVYATSTGADGEGIYVNDSGAGAYGLEVFATGGADSSGDEPTGVLGYSSGSGVWGESTGGTLNTAGVLGTAGGRTGENAIAGVWGDAYDHVGVFGSSGVFSGVAGTSPYGYGVEGTSSSAIGVYGFSGSPSNEGARQFDDQIGVWGDTSLSRHSYNSVAVLGTADDTTAGSFVNDSSDSAALFAFNDGGGDDIDNVASPRSLVAGSAKGTCGVGTRGDLTCTGQVKVLATTSGGARTVETYAMQSPENWMEDFGSGNLQNGTAKVSIDAGFAETVSETADYHVFLTPRGDSKGLYVTNMTATGFEVRESGGGTSTLGFDYRIVAKRRGYERQRMTDVTERFKADQVRDLAEFHSARARTKPKLKPTGPGAQPMRLPRVPVEMNASMQKK